MNYLRPAIIALLALAAVLLPGADTARATSFNPLATVCLDDASTTAECDGHATQGATDDILITFAVDAPDSYPAGAITFIPPEWNVPLGDTIPIGAIVGRFNAEQTVGLLSQPCRSNVYPSFTLMNGAINIDDTIDPRPVEESDVFTPLAKDANGNGIPDGLDKYPSFLNEVFDLGSGPLQPRARLMGITLMLGNWIPLNVLVFDPGTQVSTDLPPPDPALGYPVVTVQAGPNAPAAQSAITDFCSPLDSAHITFGLTRDNPCTPVPANPNDSNCPQTSDRAGAYPKVGCENKINDDPDDDGKVNDGCPQVNQVSESGAQCDNNISDDGEDAAINDGCPQAGSISESGLIPDPDGCNSDSNEASCIYRQNPSTVGVHTFTVTAFSQWDADGDGHENPLDTCVLDAEAAWNPRAIDLTFDADLDGLTAACDPNPNAPSGPSPPFCPEGNTGPDEDQDCFSNRQDNCPLVANDQSDTDHDGIGDTCDSSAASPDGHMHDVSRTSTVGISLDTDGDGVPDSSDICPNDPEDFDGFEDADGCPDTDNDGDGIPDTDDNCPNTPNLGQADSDGDGVGNACDTEGPSPNTSGLDGTDDCNDGVDNDGNGLTDAAEPACDSDGDGIPDAADNCPHNPEDFDGFEDADGCPDPDNDGDGVLDTTDNCPNDPEDFDGFEDADGCPDPDNDGDGIPDTADSCPNDPEDFDGFQDGDGCPDPDNDGDGIPDTDDNCPDTPNPSQEDTVHPGGGGDACDDPDADGVVDAVDNCPDDLNPGQGDGDGDGKGDACDDSDGDSVVDAADNCPDDPNPDQTDSDGDGLGDICDDSDGDGVVDASDPCPLVPAPYVGGCPIPVGGIVELAAAPPERPQRQAGGSGSALPYVALAGGAVIALAAGGWYARRRLS